MIDSSAELSVVGQCELLGVARSMVYYDPKPVSESDLVLMGLIDRIHLDRPFLGSRRIVDELADAGHLVNRKKVSRLMRIMGITALYAKKRTSIPNPDHRIYPYLLRDLTIDRPGLVWCSDITYLPMAHGFLYLAAVMDWFSRRVLAWELSNTLDSAFCVSALTEALALFEAPVIFNTDQGSQFSSESFTKPLLDADVKISMDGRGRWRDNVFIERLWRTVKYEEVYLHGYENGAQARAGLTRYFEYYNHQRRHQSLDRRTPVEVYDQTNPSLTDGQTNPQRST